MTQVDELSLAKLAVTRKEYGWIKELAQHTNINYQTLRDYAYRPERLDQAAYKRIHAIAEYAKEIGYHG